ncbi:MAG TPA: DUF2339 domain-containing protein, partial [Pyrinomonadaceae bacterium]|nr:DUF2339 domain-containing protein [Pyrinomonadaceae bacterium]
LMLLASLNLVIDWFYVFESRLLTEISANSFPFYNGTFFTTLLYAASFFFIFLTNRVQSDESVLGSDERKLFGYILTAIYTIVFFNAFRTEIDNYFHYLTVKTSIYITDEPYIFDKSLQFFNVIWQFNYTMFYLTLISFINIKKSKNVVFAYVNLIFNWLTIGFFITIGLFILSQLRDIYLLDESFFERGIYFIIIRYISYIFAAILIAASYFYLKLNLFENLEDKEKVDALYNLTISTALLFIFSSELLNWMDIFGYKDSYKLGLSILWGIYALILIIIGINKHKKHLRIAAIALFGLTLAKLFFYDIAELDTISKTVVFVSLGILLLIVSFLYTKYKDLIFGIEEEELKDVNG